ncbi:DUF1853 family protein [Aquimarina longa]|uniref:DUF1853 family protein n=1 Tax=Aquimarina longa TaxID=1080221 RepID=UPI0007855883|nr:DUF1853 family protein [Aquimarina longa]
MAIVNEYLGFLNSAPLWLDETLFEFSIFDFKELSKTNILPSDTDTLLGINNNQNEVLGKRIEHFFEHCILNSHRYSIISKNIQVFRDKITIGELDFILQDQLHNKIIHLELVYKFYVYDPQINIEMERWIGPNRKDTLLKKVAKLKTKQLPLLYKSETSHILESLHTHPTHINQQVCYLGALFVPLSLKNKNIPFLNNQCIIGFWIKSKEFTKERYSAYSFNIPLKKDWIVNPKYCTTWFSFEEIIVHAYKSLAKKKSPLLWMKSNGDSYERFFIVWW